MVAFNGILTAFYSYYSSNDKLKQQLNVEADQFSGRGSPWTVIDPTFNNTIKNTNWISNDSPNQKFIVTFLKHKIFLSSYSVKSRLDVDDHHPLEWDFEASNNNISWHLIHHKTRGNELKGLGKTLQFDCQQVKAYRMFRLTMIGKDSGGSNHFSLNKFEIFGEVLRKERINTICLKHNKVDKFISSIIFIHVIN